MGKLKRIKERFAKLEKNVNIMAIKLQEFESFSDELRTYKEKFNLIYDLIAVEEEQISEADMKKQMEESMNQMKEVVKQAIIEMVNKKENQEAIQQFAGQFKASATGQAGGLPFDMEAMCDKEGNLDLMKALALWWANKQQGGASPLDKITGGSGGKTTGY